METVAIFYLDFIGGFYRDNGKENGHYYNGLYGV